MIKIILYASVGILVLLLPGFLLSLVAYPGKNQMDVPTRMALSLGLGVLLNAYLGLALGRVGLLSASPFLLSSLVLCVGLAVAAILRGAYLFSPLKKLLARPKGKATPSEVEKT